MNLAGTEALFGAPQPQEDHKVLREAGFREQVTAIGVWAAIASLPHGQLLRRLR
jgi:hypothetical protein